MKNTILGLVILSSSSAALACMPAPIEWQTRVRNQMAAEAMTAVNAKVDDVKSVKTDMMKVLKYEWIQSNAGFECHDKETIQAVYTVNYETETELCSKKVSVEGVRSFYEGAPKDVYTTSVLAEASSCKAK